MVDIQSFNIAMETWGAFFCLLVLLIFAFNPSDYNKTRIFTIGFEVCGFLLMITDILCRVYRGTPGAQAGYIVRLSNMFVFIINYCYMALLTHHFYVLFQEKTGKKISRFYYLGYILAAIGIISIIINYFGEFYYYIDENNLYHRGDYYIVTQLIAFIGLAVPFTMLIRYRKKLEAAEFGVLLSYFVLPAIATVFTIFVYGTALQNFAIVLSTQLVFVYNQLGLRKSISIALDKATKANETKDRFIAHMSHDIRTPLNCINGMLDIAEINMSNTEMVKECHEKIRDASNQLLYSIDDILMVKDMQSQDFTPQNVSFSMKEILNKAKWMINVAKEVYDVELTFETDEIDSLPKCYGDPLYVQRIFTKLIDNMLKYNKHEGKALITGKVASQSDSEIHFTFTFEDTGVGMSKQFVDTIFELFNQENGEVRTNHQGTGLGLVIVKKLLSLMDGTIQIDSKKDVGTKVTIDFKLPVSQEKTEESLSQKKNNKTIKALIVEDNEINSMILANILEVLGMTYDTAENGQIAVDKFKAGTDWNYDVIFMDIMMPVMDGIQATRAIRHLSREDAKKIPIIVVTASTSEEDRRRTMVEGATKYINKPLDLDMIENVVAVL